MLGSFKKKAEEMARKAEEMAQKAKGMAEDVSLNSRDYIPDGVIDLKSKVVSGVESSNFFKDTDLDEVERYCSWCFSKSKHKLVNKNTLTRNEYICTNCDNHTLQCRYCEEMAKGEASDKLKNEVNGIESFSASWNNELCAEHDATIASFEKLHIRLANITEYKTIFEREKVNLSKVGKYAGIGVAGVVATAGVAVTAGAGAAPIAAALGNMGLLGAAGTGTAISTLSGAALTSASLAAVGGSVAAGTAIITATGLGLGGVMGGVVANKYYGEDKSFNIKQLRDKDLSSKIIFINGFTQEKEDTFLDWVSEQNAFDSNNDLYGVNWASKTRYDLGMAFGKGASNVIAKGALIEIAKKGGTTAATKLNPLGWLALLADLSGNPWHNAMFRSMQTGIQVAEAISRTDGQKFNLVGHSLGCRVIYYALEALSTKKDKYINDVIFLGGAVGRTDNESWRNTLNAIDGKIYNCFSREDKVLDIIYKTANAGLSDPIGVRPIQLVHENIINIDCTPDDKTISDDTKTPDVDSHMKWKDNFEAILRYIEKI